MGFQSEQQRREHREKGREEKKMEGLFWSEYETDDAALEAIFRTGPISET